MLITHNLGVVAGICDRVVVMYAGRGGRAGRPRRCLADPRHPYTWALLGRCPGSTEPGKDALARSRARRPTRPRSRPGARSIRAARSGSTAARRERRPEAAARRARPHAGHAARRRAGMSAAASTVAPTTPARGRGPREALPGRAAALLQRVVARRARGRRRRPRHPRAARRSGSSASPAAASRRSAARSLRLIEPTAGRIVFDGEDIRRSTARELRRDAARDADDLPGPVRVARPAQTRRRHRREAARDPRHRAARGQRRARVRELLELVGLEPPSTASATRTSSRAASASASASRGRSRSSRASSSATSRSRRSTSRSRPRSSTCSMRAAAGARADLPLHRPRPGGRQAHLRPGRGDVPRARSSRSRRRRSSTPSAPPLHRLADLGDPDHRPAERAHAAADPARRATCPRRSTRRRAAASGRAASARRSAARSRSRRSRRRRSGRTGGLLLPRRGLAGRGSPGTASPKEEGR